MKLGYNETAFVMQILLQPGRRICATQFVCIVQYDYILTTVSSLKYVMNSLLFSVLATVSVFL